MLKDISEEKSPREGEQKLKESSLINCIYFAHCSENLNTTACYQKDFRTCWEHIQQPGGNTSGKNRSATEMTTMLEDMDSFPKGNSGEDMEVWMRRRMAMNRKRFIRRRYC
jgi:hypothetical protein